MSHHLLPALLLLVDRDRGRRGLLGRLLGRLLGDLGLTRLAVRATRRFRRWRRLPAAWRSCRPAAEAGGGAPSQ